jgi:hypothetical protein
LCGIYALCKQVYKTRLGTIEKLLLDGMPELEVLFKTYRYYLHLVGINSLRDFVGYSLQYLKFVLKLDFLEASFVFRTIIDSS